MKKAILSIVLLLAGFALKAEVKYTTISNIPYHAGVSAYADERCVLDLYYPEGKADFATVVWFHGGGLTGGGKHIPQELMDKGIAVVAVNYRLMQKAEIQEICDDAAAAVAWAFKNIAKYGGSASRIFVSGHSAGGYLTSMVVLDKHYLAKYGIDADSIAGAFPFSGQAITHFAQRDKQGLGALQATVDDTAPLYHVRKLPMPFFVFSGDRETELYGRYEEQAYFWRMLKLVGCEQVYLYEFQGFDHGKMPHPAHSVMLRQIKAICEGKAIKR